jgi:hypothetical protein
MINNNNCLTTKSMTKVNLYLLQGVDIRQIDRTQRLSNLSRLEPLIIWNKPCSVAPLKRVKKKSYYFMFNIYFQKKLSFNI